MAAALATGESQSAYAPSCRYCRHGVEPEWLQAIANNEAKQDEDATAHCGVIFDDPKRYEDATLAHCAVAVLVGCEPTAWVGRRDGLANTNNDAKQCGDARAYCAVGGDEPKRYEDATTHCAVVVLLGCVATARVRRCDTA